MSRTCPHCEGSGLVRANRTLPDGKYQFRKIPCECIKGVRLDRDRLTSELQAVRGELATARDALRGIWPFIEEDDGGFAAPAYQMAINDVRAALAMTEDANP